MKLANKQWQSIEQTVFLSPPKLATRGRPPLDKQEVLEAILWVLVNDARWKQIPDNFPQYQTCRNYFYTWLKTGVMEKIIRVLMEDCLSEERIVIEDFSNINKKSLSSIIKKIQAHQSPPQSEYSALAKAGETTRHLYLNKVT